MNVLASPRVQQLSQVVEESTRSTREGVKYFVEPAVNTLARAKAKRHHIIFGRRGSGKSSLLSKVATDFTAGRIPNAYIDLEKFKGHSYPDVLISVLIEVYRRVQKLAGNSSYLSPDQKLLFGRESLCEKPHAQKLRSPNKTSGTREYKLADAQVELQKILHSADEARRQVTSKNEGQDTLDAKISSGLKSPVATVDASVTAGQRSTASLEIKDEYSSKKIEALPSSHSMPQNCSY